MIHFDKGQVARREYEQLDPIRWDFHWNSDFTECDAYPCLWWDEGSYAQYQGDAQS